jgi:hypothetical protein
MGLVIWPLRNLWLPATIVLGGLVYFGFTLSLGAITEKSIKELVFFKQGAPPADAV